MSRLSSPWHNRHTWIQCKPTLTQCVYTQIVRQQFSVWHQGSHVLRTQCGRLRYVSVTFPVTTLPVTYYVVTSWAAAVEMSSEREIGDDSEDVEGAEPTDTGSPTPGQSACCGQVSRRRRLVYIALCGVLAVLIALMVAIIIMQVKYLTHGEWRLFANIVSVTVSITSQPIGLHLIIRTPRPRYSVVHLHPITSQSEQERSSQSDPNCTLFHHFEKIQ